MGERRAIIDIGSNTVRLVVYGGPERAPRTLFNEKVTARLGRGVAEDGRLDAKAMAAALTALRRYVALLRLMQVGAVQTAATAAVRDAANGGAFLAAVAELGLEPRLLTGEEEAMASAEGVMAAFPGAAGTVADVGGGSLELTAFGKGRCGRATTLPLGTLRLAKLRAGDPDKFPRRLRKALAEANWREGKGRDLYLVGGSWRALARFSMERSHWPVDDPHGYAIDAEEALVLSRSLAHGQPQPGALPGVSNARLASLPDAAALLGALVREVEPARLVFSSWGLREGLLHQRMSAAVRAEDPLLAGIIPFAAARGCSLASAQQVMQWTAQACDGGSTRLRLPATLLAMALIEVEPNRRADEALSWALGKRWIGADASDRAMLAAVMLGNAGRMALPAELSLLAAPADIVTAFGWGLAIRLCRRFSGGTAGALPGASLLRHGGELVLAVREPFAALATDPVLKDLRVLAEWLGLSPRLRVLAPD
ncbi:MAG: hypothetical protein KGL44_08980 [Sphingomonadales bacterium]|nr:hypothetical protein [Sphingomonadales bacterium]